MAFQSDNMVVQDGGYGPGGLFNDPSMDWYAGFAPNMQVQRGFIDRTLATRDPQQLEQGGPQPLAVIEARWRSPALRDAVGKVTDAEYKNMLDQIIKGGQDANAYYGTLEQLYSGSPLGVAFAPPKELNFVYHPNAGHAAQYIGGDTQRLEMNIEPFTNSRGENENFGPVKNAQLIASYPGERFRPLPTSPDAKKPLEFGAMPFDYPYLYGYIPAAVGEKPKHNLVMAHELGHHVNNVSPEVFGVAEPSAPALAMTAAHPNINLDPQHYYGYTHPRLAEYSDEFTGPLWNMVEGYAPMLARYKDDGGVEMTALEEPWADQFGRGLELLTRHGIPSAPVSGEMYNNMYGAYYPVIQQAQNYLAPPVRENIEKRAEGVTNLDVQANLAIAKRLADSNYGGVPPNEYDKLMRALYMNMVLRPLGYPSLIDTGDNGLVNVRSSAEAPSGDTTIRLRTVPKQK